MGSARERFYTDASRPSDLAGGHCRFSLRQGSIMSMQHLLQDQVVRADPWTLFCAECSQKMRVMTATPAQEARETRTYECVCGHSERINVAIHRRRAATTAASQASTRNQRSSIKNN